MSNIMSSSSSSSSSSGSNSALNTLRITGMASGIDTDAVVKAMATSYQTKIDQQNQAEQKLQWKQAAYQGIIKDIKGLQEYFDPLSSKYILSSSSLNINATSSSNSSAVSATASASAKAGTYVVSASQLASQAKITSESSLNSMIKVTNGSEWSGAKLTLNDGTNTTTITLDSLADSNGNGTTLDEVASDINKQISDKGLSGISASYVTDASGSYIKFTNNNSTNAINVTATSGGNQLFSNSIPASSSYNYNESEDASNWSGAKLTLGGTSITLDSITDTNGNGTTLDEVVSDINKQIAANGLSGISASYVNDGTNSYIEFTSSTPTTLSATTSSGYNFVSNKSINSGVSSSTKLSDLGIDSNISFNLSYDSTTTAKPISISATSSDTLQSLMDKVNSATNGAVTMSVDDTTGKISFQSKNYGSASNITIKDTSSGTNNLSNLGIKLNASNQATASGTDAIVSITGPGQSTPTTTTQSSNNFTVNGISYNLTNANSSANITVTASADNVTKNIKSFITDYNSIISEINTDLAAKPDSNYPPLTDAQKASMTTDQINAWETKAKVGILNNDDMLTSLKNDLTGIFSSPVYSSYNSASPNTGKVSLSFGQYGSNAIGIDTSSDVSSAGELVIQDPTKLQNAIENNFSDFQKLFMGASSTTVSANQSYIGSTQYMQDGILTRINNVLKDYVSNPGLGEDGTYSLAGKLNIFVNKQYDYSTTGYSSQNTLPDQIYIKSLNISDLQTQMNNAENRYYAQFTALETAMSKLNAQQSTISSMLGTSSS